MVLSGSANRATALLNGQIQGTIVRLEDWIAVTGGEDERAKILGVLAETQSDLLTSAFVVSADALEERPEMVEAFLTEVQAQIDAIYADPAAYAEAALPHLEGADLESVTGVFEALAEQEMFPRQMGVSREAIEGTMSFYAASGKLEEGKITADDVADFRFAE
jgi:ABC-type nitrate/sulfonate/bicarbonate transport system substrate-binding protein